MKGKTWLWIALGALALVSVCCLGILFGGAIARQNTTQTEQVAAESSQPTETPPSVIPTEALPSPTKPPPTATPIPTEPPTSTERPLLPPTATAVPKPPAPPAPPSAPPAGSDLQALVDYANAMQPLLDEAGIVVQRDGEILKASEGGNDAVLCDGRLAADNDILADVVRRVRAISPPANAAQIHDLTLRSGDAWTEAMGNVEQFCATGNQLYKLPAVLKFWEAAASFQDAANRFWLLLIAEGVEDWVQR